MKKIMQKLNSDTRASVLMEAVIVMPLYLLLFGGMMLLGDVASGCVKLLSANRYLSWMAEDRLLGSTKDNQILDLAEETFGFGESDSEKTLRYPAQGISKNHFAEDHHSDNGDQISNTWSFLLSADIPLEMKAPWYYQGAIAVHEIMTNNKSQEYFGQQTFSLSKSGRFSHYVLKSRVILADSKLVRELPGEKLAQTMSWLDIAHDFWIAQKDTKMKSIDKAEDTSSSNESYMRQLEIYGGDE